MFIFLALVMVVLVCACRNYKKFVEKRMFCRAKDGTPSGNTRVENGISLVIKKYEHGSDAAGTTLVFYLHGNGITLVDDRFQGDMDRIATEVCESTEQKVACMSFDYRGYGDSRGTPTCENAVEDALFALGVCLKEEPDITRILVYGKSLGAAVATRVGLALVKDPRFKGVMLEVPFLGTKSLRLPLVSLLPPVFDCVADLNALSEEVPVWAIVAEHDEIINSRFLKRQLKSRVRLHVVDSQEAHHNNIPQFRAWNECVKAWLTPRSTKRHAIAD